MSVHPIFATREPLHIAAMQKLLADAGIVGDLSVVYPEELERAAVDGSDCLVIVDGQSPPPTAALARTRRAAPGARILIWTDTLVPELLLATMECGLNGLIGSDLPPEEAAEALARICRGERILRYNAELEPLTPPSKPQISWFDAQWMLEEAESRAREK